MKACMVGRMGGGLNLLVEIELKNLKMAPITNLNNKHVEGELLLCLEANSPCTCHWRKTLVN